MSKIKNNLSVLCNNKKNTNTTWSFGFRWAPILIFQLFVALLVVQSTAWAGLTSLTVDANGDSVFNGVEEKLSITFTTDALDNTQAYEIKVDDKKISGSLAEGVVVANGTVVLEWDGKLDSGGSLSDGDYTLLVNLTRIADPRGQLTATVTLDTTDPVISIGLSENEFSPVLYSLPVYYDLNEEVAEAWLEFGRESGGSIGSRIPLETSSGSHTYYWDGDDYNSRPFEDGKYKLKLRVKDRGGNEAPLQETETITMDTVAPLITGVSINDSISLVSGMFVNASVQSISLTATDEGGTGVDLTGRDTEIRIKPIGGADIRGSLTTSGNNKATFTPGNSLDELSENGNYEVLVFTADNVGNLASSRIIFTFDNAAPILKSVATNRGEFTPGSGLSGWTNYVEAILEDNIELNLADSSIRLTGPDGSTVLGNQTQHNDDKIRWQLLSPLLASDGLQDGQYSIEIVGKDKAGNETSPIQITFLFDNLAPALISLQPTRDGEPFNFLGDTAYYNLPLNQFVATFDDGEFGTGVLFSGGEENSRIMFGTPTADGGVNIRQGRAFPDNNNDVLTYILNTPLLKTDGSQDGEYILNVTAADPLGNIKTYSHRIVYDTQIPTLISTVPAENQTISDISDIVVKLNEVTSGIDFVQSNFQLIRNDGDTQIEVPVNISSNGTDTATLTLLQSIALDGSDDGTYTIEVTPTDLAGNSGSIVRRQFYLASQTQPQIRLTTPETGSVSSLSSITVEIVNYIGSGINFDVSTIAVINPQGQIVPQAKVEADATTNQLTWTTEASIPRNGTADGEYTISTVFVDFSGKFFTQQFPLVLDTQFPRVDTVTVATDPQLGLSINSATDISETFSQITVNFSDQDIDFENTAVSLIGPDTTEIAVHQSDDGKDLLTLNFQNLAQLGTYTLTVTPIDRIGNISDTPFTYRFHLDIAVPVVSSVLIGGQSAAVAYVNGSAGEIIATLQDSTGTGLAVGEEESSIIVTTESGLPVPGDTTLNEQNQLIWKPIALPTDGSADGRYTVTITPVDKAGRIGDVAYRSFIFDTQAPRVTGATPVTINQPTSYIGESLTHLQFTVEDIGPALLDLEAQTITLRKKDGEAVLGQITHDRIDQLFFTLSVPLPTNGSADGEYTLTIDLVDKAGNAYQIDHNIFYDSQAPQLSLVSLNTETPLNLIPYQVNDLSEPINKLTLDFIDTTQVDFANTVISLIGPDGSVIPLTLENNGVDQLTASFVSVTQDGLYTLSVTPQDVVGNVAQGAVPYLFRLQFQITKLSSVSAKTADSSIQLIQHEIIQISEPINSLVFEFVDATQIDFQNTSVVLTDPNGQEITITQEDDVDSKLVVDFVSLTQSGLYALAITPQDRAGNIAQRVTQYQFRLNLSLPVVSSVLIDGQLGSTIYVNNPDTQIVATFTESTGTGLNFGDGGSAIVVTNPDGIVIPGSYTSNELNQLSWVPTALPTDGSADGRYTVSITPVDGSGRSGTVVNRQFIYDTQAPRITLAIPVTLHQPISYIGSLTQFQFTVEDVGPALLNLDVQEIGLKNRNDEAVLGQITHDGTNQLFFTLAAPLPTDGSSDGEFVLVIGLVDRAGNSYQTEHSILYDSQVPQLSSISVNTETPLDLTPYQVTDLSESVNEFTLTFIETTRVDFANTIITLTDPNDSNIPLTLENNGVDQLTASFVSLSQSGLYILSVTPQDIVGNVAQGAIQYPFRLLFEVPRLSSVKAVTSNASVDLTAYETVEISESINSFLLGFTNVGQVDIETTSVSLTGPAGQEIEVTLEENNSGLVVRFVSLTQSGIYTLAVTLQDIAGSASQGAVQYPFNLQFQVPRLSSVKAITSNASVDLTAYDTVEISESINNLTLEFTDAKQIDFENTIILLTGPNGEEILVASEEDDNSQLLVSFISLTQSGLYTLSVTSQDRAGNVAQSATQYQFRLNLSLPVVSSILIDGQVGSTIYVNNPDTKIVATFTEPTGTGLDFGDGGSTIVVTNPEGIVIPGIYTSNELNQLSWVPTALPTDGSADGRYAVSITPVDRSGRSGTVVNRQFIYDTQAPRITLSTPVTLHQANSYIGSLTQFQFTIEDVGPALLNLAAQEIGLQNKNGEAVLGQITHDGTNQLFFTLGAPLSTDGSADGEYRLTIGLVDRAGNTYQTEHNIFYDSQAPSLSSVSLNTETPLDLTPYKITDLSESVNQFTLNFIETTGVDFANTVITLTGPNDSIIPLTLENNAVDQLTASFVSLSQRGLYTLSVTPQDRVGNVAQGVVQYPFNLRFEVPRISSVKAVTSNASLDLTAYETVEILESINSFVLGFTDGDQIDFENTSVSLTGPSGEDIEVSLEENNSELLVRFVSLTQSGSYTLSVTLQDIAGSASQGAVQYPFSLLFEVPRLSSVKAVTSNASLDLTAYETVEISESINSFLLGFTNVKQIDIQTTSVSLTGPSGDIEVSLEEDTSGLLVRFVSLTQSGSYTLSVTPQDIAGSPPQSSVLYPFSLLFEVPRLSSVKAVTSNASLDLTAYETVEILESINSFVLGFTDGDQIDFENTSVSLTGPSGEDIEVSLEENNSELLVRFVSLTQSGEYTLSVTLQDIAGSASQGAVQYPFSLLFEVPRLSSVKAVTSNASLDLTAYETVEISESINSFLLGFTNVKQIDIQTTSVSLTGPSGDIEVSLEENTSGLLVRFVSLTQSGSYTLSVTPQDIAGSPPQSSVLYPFSLLFEVPRISSVKAVTSNTSLDLTAYETVEISESINSFLLGFTNVEQIDLQTTSVSLTGPSGDIEVSLEEDTSGLLVRFVSLTQSGVYTLSVTLQDIAGSASQGAVQYPFSLLFEVPRLSSVKAVTSNASLDLTAYETVEISESINSFLLGFTNVKQIDIQTTSVSLTGPSGDIEVSLEENTSGLLVRFVSLTQSGSYTLSVTPQDIAGSPPQSSVLYPFSLLFEVPRLSSVKAVTSNASLDLTAYETVEILESINSFVLGFTDGDQIDFENTSVSLTGPSGEDIEVSLEENNSELLVRFVSLTQSGSYTLSVTPQDKAGSPPQDSVLYPFSLRFKVPRLSSVKAVTSNASLDLTAYETVEILESINSFVLGFTDGDQIDFENTSVSLTGPSGEDIEVSLEENNSELLVRFVSLTQSGEYTLSVTLQDIAGSASQGAVQYPFSLLFEVPRLSSVKAVTSNASLDLTAYETVEISESINSFLLGFTNVKQIDIQTTSVSLTGPSGDIEVSLEEDTSGLLVRFVSLTQSGSYTLSVTPQDKAGSPPQDSVLYPFSLLFEVPRLSSVKAVTSNASVDLTAYETVEISESINSFLLGFTNVEQIDIETTSISLTGPNDDDIQVTLEEDTSGLVVRFVSLTQSGTYTLSVTPQDIAGSPPQGSVLYPFRLRFHIPELLSVKATANDSTVDLRQHEIIEISESVNKLTLEFTNVKQIDFENTNILLTGPNGEEIFVTTEEDGNSQLVVSFISLTESGLYALSVTPQDRAGNIAQSATRYQFRLEISLPIVSSVLIDGKPGSVVYVRNSIPRIVATFSDPNGVGVSLGENGSTVEVTNSEGFIVSGIATSDTNELTWTPTALPSDGSADGQYTVAITPVDKSGRAGTVVNRQFIYDTQAPRIMAATPLTLHAPVSYIGGGLSQFVINIEDVGPAGLILVSQVVALMDPTGNPVSAVMTYDELTNQLYLTLSKPFANDGSVDGNYTLNVLLIDKAGNRTNSRYNIIYDSKTPQVASVEVNTAGTPMELVPNEVAEISESISNIIVQFDEATLVDFQNTDVSLVDPDGQIVSLSEEDDGVSLLTLNFVGLTQIGQYTLSLTPQDVAGNAAQNPIQFPFLLEFILPAIESIVIGDTVTLGSGDTAYVNANNLVIEANLLDPAGTGLSFDSTGSNILVATLDDIIVPGTFATNETDVLIWKPVTLSTDGSSDGRYAVYVTPVDKEGREGNTAYREFVYDTQEPEITAADPINLSQPVSYISESLTQFSFTLQDVGPADITLDDQRVSLRSQNGTLIPTKLTHDSNNQFFLTLDEPLPLDGSRDGEYTVVTAFSDKAGNTLEIEHPIVYDTQAPTLVSTVPAHGAQLTEDVTQIQVNLDDKGESGIDWSATTVSLVDPDGVLISGELTSNGKTQLTLRTNQLVADGQYVIRVQAIDRAGNGGKSVFEHHFLLSRLLPAVLSTSPTTAPSDEAYTNKQVGQIEVELETSDEGHLSTLSLLNSEGQVVAGQQQRQSDGLRYTLVRPLATDGSEDGIYTIEFTPISASGRSGEVQQLTFTYDTQEPEVEPEAVNLIVTEPEVNNSLIEIHVAITDNQAGIDWENLDEDWISFERISPNATQLDGRVSFNEQDQLIFRLAVPLADNGSADGIYKISVTPIDQAGNGDETYEKVFTYDTSPPVIDPNSLLLNDMPLLTDITADDYPSAISTTGGVVIQASVTDTGLGVNLSQSMIVVRNPNGDEVSGSTQQNGVDTIVFKSDGLPIEGIYIVTVTGTGNDSELLGFAPKGSITTEFLYETTTPTGVVTDDGGNTELTDEPIPFQGTATDPQGIRRLPPQQGDGEVPIPASGVWLVEIVGTGPDGQPIEPVPAEDESDAQQQPWSRWSADFLPTRSGDYDLDLRVTDKAGNFAVYDVGEYTMSVSFSFNGNTFGWPNPLRHSKSDVAFFSFDLNAAADENVELNLYIYDWGGDMVYSNTYSDVIPGERNDTQIKWNLENQSGTPVARGLYVFRLEAVNGAGNRANAVGKVLVVD